jgi:O-antigen ligase
VLNLVIGGVLYARISSLFGDYVVEQRGALMLAGVLMFLAHPLVGVGPGGFGASLDEFGPQIDWLYDYTGSAHNAYIHSAAEMGGVGLLAFVAFLGSCFVALLLSARRGRGDPNATLVDTSLRDTAFWAFATVCLVSLFEWPLAHGIGELIILIAALGFAMSDGPVRSAP